MKRFLLYIYDLFEFTLFIIPLITDRCNKLVYQIDFSEVSSI